MKAQSIGFIGGGRVTKIILTALENANEKVEKISVFDPQEAVLENLKKRFPAIMINSAELAEVTGAEVVFLAVHPPVMMETLGKLKDLLSHQPVLVSLAPKFSIQKISDALNGFHDIVRINPSASSVINKGINPVCFSSSLTTAKRAAVVELMSPLGALPEVSEPKIEAYAMISAMGPTYFWPQFEKLRELAVSFGMDETEAKEVIGEMLQGTHETLFKSGLTYAEVMDLVPVKPLGEVESVILAYYDQYLNALYQKIKA